MSSPVHEQSVYTTSKGTKLTMLNQNILVELDPIDNKVGESGLLVAPDGAMEHVYATGTIRAFGSLRLKKSKKEIPIPELEVGLKCCFIRFLKDQDSNKKMREILEENLIRIQPSDILFVFTKDDNFKLSQ